MMRHSYAITVSASQVNENLAEGVRHLLSALGNRYVAYYPSLVECTGSPKAALMLGHAMYMTRVVMEKQPKRGGWFWKTSREWKQVTGLSVRELETSRNVLLENCILHEERRGMPAKLWFRVDLDRLALVLCQYANTAYRPWSWDDRVLKTLLGKPVMFYAPFAWLAESALAGLYMSSLFNRMRQSLSKDGVDDQGWFSSPVADSLRQLNFGRRMLNNARAKLVESEMMEEMRESRMQSQLLSRIMLTTLPAKISLEANKFHSLAESNILDCRNPTNKSCSKRETRVAGTMKQELPDPQSNCSHLRETCSAETASLSIKEELNTPYHPLHRTMVEVEMSNSSKTTLVVSANANLENLIYPDKLLPEERQRANQVLHGSPDPQVILDELAGQMQDGHIKNAIGYLRTLKSRQLAGTLELDLAYRVAAERKRRQDILVQRKNLGPQPQPEASREFARLRLTELRQSLWGNK